MKVQTESNKLMEVDDHHPADDEIHLDLQKKLDIEKKNRSKERKRHQDKIEEFEREFKSHTIEREEMCKIYLHQFDRCLRLQEEKKGRDSFVKEVLKLLKQRTEELQTLKKSRDMNNITPPQSFCIENQQSAKKKIIKMFFQEKLEVVKVKDLRATL